MSFSSSMLNISDPMKLLSETSIYKYSKMPELKVELESLLLFLLLYNPIYINSNNFIERALLIRFVVMFERIQLLYLLIMIMKRVFPTIVEQNSTILVYWRMNTWDLGANWFHPFPEYKVRKNYTLFYRDSVDVWDSVYFDGLFKIYTFRLRLLVDFWFWFRLIGSVSTLPSTPALLKSDL